uniref:SFRICE_020510 n=1 Tax=Spodoptera frugiperda TaxID=7108 RepID=A0A2H1W9X3_SPOFR
MDFDETFCVCSRGSENGLDSQFCPLDNVFHSSPNNNFRLPVHSYSTIGGVVVGRVAAALQACLPTAGAKSLATYTRNIRAQLETLAGRGLV